MMVRELGRWPTHHTVQMMPARPEYLIKLGRDQCPMAHQIIVEKRVWEDNDVVLYATFLPVLPIRGAG
jgi:hypothetical protein